MRLQPTTITYLLLIVLMGNAADLDGIASSLAHTNLSAAPPTVSRSQEVSKVFPETGKTLRGRFLQYWEQNGGLARHGYPISEEMQEKSDTDGKTYTVQYLERSVFELHPQNQPPYDVLLQLLGVFRYREMYDPYGPYGQKANTEPGAEKFPQTDKTIGGKFLEYWKKNGGLPRFGYPISDEFQETSPLDGSKYTMQYFERAVFELHSENQPPYDVLLAQLGTFRWRTRSEDPVAVTPQFRSDIPDGEYIPMYPGSVLKRSDEVSLVRSVLLEVPADAVRVKAFYDYVLPKYGWVFLYDNAGVPNYNWTDPKGVVSWHLSIDLWITGSSGSGRSEVRLYYNRYPDTDKMPLYPGAQSVEVRAGQSGPPWPASCSDTVTNTTFLTADSPSQVESFYRSTLPTHGWRLVPDTGSIQSPVGLQLSSVHKLGLRRGIWTSRHLTLNIIAQADRDGLTRITVVLKTCKFDWSP